MKNLNEEKTGLILELSTLNGALGIKNPDIHIEINQNIQNVKFGKHFFELTPGKYLLRIKVGDFLGKSITDQNLDIEVKQKSKTLIDYKIDLLLVSSVSFREFVINDKEDSEEAFWKKTKTGAGRLGYFLGKITGRH